MKRNYPVYGIRGGGVGWPLPVHSSAKMLRWYGFAACAGLHPHTQSRTLTEPAIFLSNDHPDPAELDHALVIINNWRSSHAYPLNTFQATLRYKSDHIYKKSLVAQRIKRLSSINEKLRRFRWLKLSEMQDIGGCRAIVKSIKQVDELIELYKKSGLKHTLVHEDDYIRKPKRSGYRGYHLIYRYNSDKLQTYNTLKIEMQLRSAPQHAWATAVETVGAFTKQALKSSQGEKDWLRFFALMGSAMALRERAVLVPETPESRSGLISELRRYARSLDVENRLLGYRAALQVVEDPGMKGVHFYLVNLDMKAQRVRVMGYRREDLEDASKAYLDLERKICKDAPGDAVLVSVDSISALRRAYPNYFFDTHLFIEALTQALKGP